MPGCGTENQSTVYGAKNHTRSRFLNCVGIASGYFGRFGVATVRLTFHLTERSLMRKLGYSLLLLLCLGFPEEVHCPEHGYAHCFRTGDARTAKDGHLMHKYHCTCGDDWWIRD